MVTTKLSLVLKQKLQTFCRSKIIHPMCNSLSKENRIKQLKKNKRELAIRYSVQKPMQKMWTRSNLLGV